MPCLDCSRLSYAYALWGILAGGFVLICLVGAYLERKR